MLHTCLAQFLLRESRSVRVKP
jgi:hypothetical protein